MLIVLLAGFVNSVGFLVIFLYYGLRANSVSLPNNIANDPLRCCVFYSSPNSGCQITDGPCTPDFPQTRSDLHLNESFVFYVSMGVIITVLEFIMIILVLILRRTRIEKEKEFFTKTIREEMGKNAVFETTPMERKIGSFYGQMNGFIRRTLNEIGKVPSQSGFTANMDMKFHNKKNQ